MNLPCSPEHEDRFRSCFPSRLLDLPKGHTRGVGDLGLIDILLREARAVEVIPNIGAVGRSLGGGLAACLHVAEGTTQAESVENYVAIENGLKDFPLIAELVKRRELSQLFFTPPFVAHVLVVKCTTPDSSILGILLLSQFILLLNYESGA